MARAGKSSDVNVTAWEILNAITGEPPALPTFKRSIRKKDPAMPGKNPAAVALGRLGGLKGGKARSAALSDTRKSEIAQKAAKARWANK